MGAGWRLLVSCLVGGLIGLTSFVGLIEAASAEQASSSMSLSAPPLVTADSVSQTEETLAQSWADRNSPEAADRREASRTRFENLDGEQVRGLVGKDFPLLVDQTEGVSASLPEGQRITGYTSINAARVALGDDKYGILESTLPIATETASGQLSALNLDIAEDGGRPEVAKPLVALTIPQRLEEGVQIPESGISITPVTEAGAALTGRGSVDGAAMLYTNTQTDSDTVVKATTLGFSADVLLRSAQSPRHLSFRVGMPRDAHLAEIQNGLGAIGVVREGEVLGMMRAPAAWDATGAAVPLTTSVHGDDLNIEIKDNDSEYEFPIEVDPEFNVGTDTTISMQAWKFAASEGGFSAEECCAHQLYLVQRQCDFGNPW